MKREKIIDQLKSLPIEERISIIQELLETIKPEYSTDARETSSTTSTIKLTVESLFAKFESQGKVIHPSPPIEIENDEPIMGAGGAIPRVSS